jgi:lysophospholipase L1-like esterase
MKISMAIKILCTLTIALFVMGCTHQGVFKQHLHRTRNISSDITKKRAKKIHINKKSVIDFMGSSVTYGYGATYPSLSWVGRLDAYLSKSSKNIKVNNYAVSGYSTVDVINSGIIDKVIADRADIVVFEDCLINDFGRTDIGLDKTNQNIQIILERLGISLPHAKIIILPPNMTMATSNNAKSALGDYTYTEYVRNVGKSIKQQKNVAYIDFWPDYEKYLRQNNLRLQDTLIQDGTHPNDLGYDFWFHSLKDHFIVR